MGTLSNVKARFKHKSASPKVNTNVQHATQLMNFVTQAMVCLAAMEVLGLSSYDAVPMETETGTDVALGLKDTTCMIVDMLLPEKNETNENQTRMNCIRNHFCCCQAEIELLDGMLFSV